MIAGYVRLSRDDDKKNYISIENQKMIINQYAASQELVIDRWYEDDGVSGYVFNRPGFSQLMEDLDKDIDVIIAKDLSRIGRHNAKVLLLLDDLKERGKRLLLVDDNYDTNEDEDDVIGIKTWYNERYVKDTSKKIRKVIKARQSEGTFMIGVPFGYVRSKNDKTKIEIVEKEAAYIRRIFDLYLSGYGYRKIANILSEQGAPTPSMLIHDRRIAEGIISKRAVTNTWSDKMIADILKNDFYIGNLRLHKRGRTLIHGTDHRIPKEEQYLFVDHHAAIIEKNTYDLVQEIMQKRVRTNYRGQSEEGSIFGCCLFCKNCGSRLTPIIRNKNKENKYYICSTYNTKGKRFCEHAHLINESVLLQDLTNYIKLCRDTLSDIINHYDMKSLAKERKSIDSKRNKINEDITSNKKQLKLLISQKIKDLSSGADEEVINETYGALQNDIIVKINEAEQQLKLLDDSNMDKSDIKDKLETALDVIDNIIKKGCINRKDVEILVERITVDQDGMPDIELKYGLSGLIRYNPVEEMNKKEDEIIIETMKLIYDEKRSYTSAKYLSAKLTELGYNKSKKSVLPYISVMIDQRILEPTEDSLKPYRIIVSKEKLFDMIKRYIDIRSARWNAGNGI